MDKFYTVSEIAQILHCTPRTILTYIRAGKLAANKVCGKWIVTESELKAFTNTDKQPTPAR